MEGGGIAAINRKIMLVRFASEKSSSYFAADSFKNQIRLQALSWPAKVYRAIDSFVTTDEVWISDYFRYPCYFRHRRDYHYLTGEQQGILKRDKQLAALYFSEKKQRLV